MHLMIYSWRAWNQRDVEEALQALGHTLCYLPFCPENIEEDDSFVEQTVTDLKKEQPQALFSINYFPVLAEACHETGIPYICWNCDGSLLAMYHRSVFYDTNFIFTFDRACCEEFHKYGVSQIWHLPLGVNPKLPAFQSTPALDISFVGNLYQKNAFDRISSKLPPYLAGYLDCALLAQQKVSGGNMLDALLTAPVCDQLESLVDYKRSKDSFATVRQLFSSTVLGFKAESLRRHAMLQSLARLGRQLTPAANVHLFTEDTDTELLFVTVHPAIDYQIQMPQIFHTSRINLHSTVPTIRSGISLRVWDVLRAGGFLLTDYQTELEDYLTPGRHLAVYEDTEELTALAAYYLTHETKRCTIAQAGQDLVLREHTWQARLTTLFSTLIPYLH